MIYRKCYDYWIFFFLNIVRSCGIRGFSMGWGNIFGYYKLYYMIVLNV